MHIQPVFEDEPVTDHPYRPSFPPCTLRYRMRWETPSTRLRPISVMTSRYTDNSMPIVAPKGRRCWAKPKENVGMSITGTSSDA